MNRMLMVSVDHNNGIASVGVVVVVLLPLPTITPTTTTTTLDSLDSFEGNQKNKVKENVCVCFDVRPQMTQTIFCDNVTK